MGDRAIIHVHSKKQQDISPAIYLHWGGSSVPTILANWWSFMESRRGDVPYGAARLIGLLHVEDAGSCLSLGIWNLAVKVDNPADWYTMAIREITGKAYSHGDSGVWLVDADTGDVEVCGGYGVSHCLEDVSSASPSD